LLAEWDPEVPLWAAWPLPELPPELALPLFARAAGFTEGGGPSGGAVIAGSAVAADAKGGRVTGAAVAAGGVARAKGAAVCGGIATGAPQPPRAKSAAAITAVRTSRRTALHTSPHLLPSPGTARQLSNVCQGLRIAPGLERTLGRIDPSPWLPQ